MRGLFDNPLQLLLVLFVIVVLFGAKRMPDAARGLGRSLRIFKSEVTEMHEDDRRSRPAPRDPGHQPEPLEGRLIDRPTTPREHPHPTDRNPEA